jgi:diguanylate cyclase (GGDEF)-like protein/PAS domain S-box-containing protein
MKNWSPRLTPATRIALGLISLIVTLLLLVDIALNLVPDEADMQRKIRQSTSERLAVEVTSLIQGKDWNTLKAALSETVARDDDILSLAVRRQDGRIVVQAGDHQRYWAPPAGGKSTLTNIRVPVYQGQANWGEVEISYKPVTPQTLMDWIRQPLIALGLVIVPVGFLAFYLYLRRSLQYLDPTAAIPDRVRVAFDALTEGVAVIDRNGRIMLTNKALHNLHPDAAHGLIGQTLSEQSWLTHEGEDHPWTRAMETRTNVSNQQFSVTRPDQSVARVIVNAAPIQDARGKLRGCMVTFYDVTELHFANEQMRAALIEVEASREEIEQKNLELVRLATRDPLTGCHNRRAFFSAAEPLFDKFRQEGRNLCCIMSDIDHFKVVNDSYGHTVGDQAIVSVARALTLGLRANDLLCRYGGEEFCILLPDATNEQAMEIAKRLRQEIEQNAGPSVRSIAGLRLTSSFGVASFTPELVNLNELIELSDYALYVSKRNGRNRVTLWAENLSTDSADPRAESTNPIAFGPQETQAGRRS